MYTKNLLGALCTIGIGVNLIVTSQVLAMSVSVQESQAQRWINEKFSQGYPAQSAEAQVLGPIVLDLQKRLCAANNIEITTLPFQHDDDYLSKVHPMTMADNYKNATALGAGYNIMGVESITQDAFGGRYKNFSQFYDYIAVEKDIAHETAHNTKGHATKKMALYDKELEAEQGAFAYVNQLPEGGWGAYYVACARFLNRPEQNMAVFNESLSQVADYISIDTSQIYNVATYYWDAKGNPYEITSSKSPFNSDKESGIYLAGQLAEAIQNHALTLNNIHVTTNNLRELKFSGNMLVCQSPNLINSQRILTNTYLTEEELEQIKALVRNGAATIDMYDTDSASWGISSACKVLKKNLPDFDKRSRAYWRTWLTCAIAYDIEKNR